MFISFFATLLKTRAVYAEIRDSVFTSVYIHARLCFHLEFRPFHPRDRRFVFLMTTRRMTDHGHTRCGVQGNGCETDFLSFSLRNGIPVEQFSSYKGPEANRQTLKYENFYFSTSGMSTPQLHLTIHIISFFFFILLYSVSHARCFNAIISQPFNNDIIIIIIRIKSVNIRRVTFYSRPQVLRIIFALYGTCRRGDVRFFS